MKRVSYSLALALAATLLAGASAKAALIHEYTFNDGTAADSVGAANGTLVAPTSGTNTGVAPTISAGAVSLLGGANVAASQAVSLPAGDIAVNTLTNASFVTWFTAPSTPAKNSQLFAFGGTASNYGYGYLLLNPNNGSSFRTAISSGPSSTPGWKYGESVALGGATSAISDNKEHMIAVTLDGTNINISLDGGAFVSHALGSMTMAGLSNNLAELGVSLYPGDPGFTGSIDEFDIYDNALATTDVQTLYTAGPVQGTPAPEPAGLGILAFAGAALLKRRR